MSPARDTLPEEAPDAGEIRVLIIEDSEDDALLAKWAMHRGGFTVLCRRIETAAELREALAEDWDAVLCDYNLPSFGAFEALRMVRAARPDLPFILVSGAIGEETAVGAMKAGANDYVMKGSLARLPEALRRELEDTRIRAAHRKAQRELAASEHWHRLLFHGNPLPLWVYDVESLRILEVNEVACAKYGYSRAEFLAMTLRDLCPAEDIPLLEREVAAPPERRAAGRTFRHRLRGGTVIDVEVRCQDISFDGHGARLASALDMTERLRAETQLQRLHAELEARVEARTGELRVANRELEAFAHSVSHDLRAPLLAMRRFAEALRCDFAALLDARGLDYLDRIRGGAQRMDRLIEDLLQLSRISRTPVSRGEVDVTQLAQRVVAELREAEPRRRCEIAIEPGMGCRGDGDLLGIALTNLIGNAWKFSSGRDVAAIQVGREAGAAVPTFFVRDQGAGFDPAFAGRLFGAFQRLHSVSEFPGTGIGLAIVRRVVERHGGSVTAEGSVGGGATFTFSVPEDSPQRTGKD